jgi:hypothetical protein
MKFNLVTREEDLPLCIVPVEEKLVTQQNTNIREATGRRLQSKAHNEG